MKKTILGLVLVCASASSFAATPLISKYDSALLEVSYVDSEIEDTVDGDGFRFNYERELGRSIGLHFQHDRQGFEENGYELDFNHTQLGFTFDLPLKTDLFTIAPEIGLSHADVEVMDDTGLYIGVNVDAELIHNALYGRVYARSYDDDVLDGQVYGVKLSHTIDRDISLHVGFEDSDNLQAIYAGVGFTF